MNAYRSTAHNYRYVARMTAAEAETKCAEVAESVVKEAREILEEDGTIRTGRLYRSLRHEPEQEHKPGVAIEYIIADAENPETGQEYAEFVEYGTGVYNEHGDGRRTPWKYKDEDGQWHTTIGQKAKPFMRPALMSHTYRFLKKCKDLIDEITEEIISFKSD